MPASDLLIASSDGRLRRRLVLHFRREPGLRWIHEAKDRAEVERALPKLTPSVLLLDLPMKGFRGPESLRSIQALSPTTLTILLVESPDDSAALQALKEGARGYCSRNTEPLLLRKAVQLVRKGEIWVGRSVAVHLLEELTALHARRARPADQRLVRMTGREREIVRLIAAGASNKEIADRLSITERTVKAHLTNIFRKLGVSSRLHLAIYALETEGPG